MVEPPPAGVVALPVAAGEPPPAEGITLDAGPVEVAVGVADGALLDTDGVVLPVSGGGATLPVVEAGAVTAGASVAPAPSSLHPYGLASKIADQGTSPARRRLMHDQ
jgi:hypothetical protein